MNERSFIDGSNTMTLTERTKNRIRFFIKRVPNPLPGLGDFALLESDLTPSNAAQVRR
jgi:hypothetical protein